MSGPNDAASLAPLTDRIRAAGNLGLTVAQLAKATGGDREELLGRLRSLERLRRVVRVGHGLWVDSSLRTDPSRAPGYVGPEIFLATFLSERELTAAPYDGGIQFRPNTQEPVHRWWPYVQGFSADLVRTVARRERIGAGSVVLDPYAGSGTVTVVARELGARGIGIELLPVSALVARAKQLWETEPEALRRGSARLLRSAQQGPMAAKPFLRETDRQFAPGPLRSLRRLKRALSETEAPDPVRELLTLAFARILVDSSRMRRSPCLGYGPKPAVAPRAPFDFYRDAVARIAEDLERLRAVRSSWGPPAEIRPEDSREAVLGSGSVDLAVTSPPYANGMDYVMNYKLEMAWLDLVRSYADLRALKRRMVACDNLPKGEVAQRPGLSEVGGSPGLAPVLARLREELARKPSYRRGDMDAVVGAYFADLKPTIARVFRALKPGAAYVVVNGDSWMAGTYVPSDLLYGGLAEEAGFRVERFEVARRRRSGQRRDLVLRESILTLRRPA